MEYNSFNQIDLPNLTVTEPNPSHALAFRRYASHAVARWHRAQVAAIRPHSDAPISHNFMGRVTDFDHFDLSEDLEIATWDSYPMGFLEDRVPADTPHKQLFMRQGDPDFQAFHHDLYRAVGRGRWWVAEQQPGPVNWAPSNPAPMPGMVRLWTWEAFAHGAEAVCYFRWRQAPFAQEQHHAGLLRPDSVDAPGLIEARQVARELAKYPDVETAQSPVALIFDYTSQWAAEIQPQGEGYDYFALVFHIYRMLRRLGQSVDILPPTAQALDGYSAVFVPGLLTIPETLRTALATCEGQVVTGPRTDLKTPELTTKVPLGPDLPGLDVTVTRVETFRPDVTLSLAGGGAVQFWLEDCETSADVLMRFGQQPVFMRSGARWHIAGWPDAVAARRMVTQVLEAAGLPVLDLPEGVRVRQAGAGRIWFNYANEQKDFGEISLPPAGVHWDAP
jgi:beta-galactosidase